MGENGVSKPCLHLLQAKGDNFYPMFFGIACGLFASEGLSNKVMNDERWLDTRDKMLQGSAHLLGLLIWRVQRHEVDAFEKRELLHKLEAAEKEVRELKKRRTEDARANEKVVSIFASREQAWFCERRTMRQHISALVNDFGVLERMKHEEISELSEKLQQMEQSLRCKNDVFKEEGMKKKDLEETLRNVESLVEELREAAKREAQEHTSELWKQKSAMIEFVNNQHRLEAEVFRALKQAETAKQQLDIVFKEKNDSNVMVKNLSIELEKVKDDSEQKDKILSTLLTKSKLNTEDKRMMLKAVNLSKARMKQSETERRRLVSEPKSERQTLRSILSKKVSSRFGVSEGNSTAAKDAAAHTNDHDRNLIDLQTKADACWLQSNAELMLESKGEHELSVDIKRLDSWVCLQAENYRNCVEQRHQLELEAFSGQIRLKNERLERMELESKRLSSQIEGLNKSISQLKHDRLKLETLLEEREAELKLLKGQIPKHLNLLAKQRYKFHLSRLEPTLSNTRVCTKVETSKDELIKKELNAEKSSVEAPQQLLFVKDDKTEPASKDASSSEETTNSVSMEIVQREASTTECSTKGGLLLDIHALGVSYKIKRLKQLLVMLERVTAKQGDVDSGESEDQDKMRMEGFMLLSLLNRQATRYNTLQDKADDLCKRMHEKDVNTKQGQSTPIRTKEASKRLENFLDETFQLQRLIVASGQKQMEIQSKIVCGFTGIAEKLEGSICSFDMRRFSDNILCLVREIQKGLEVRIARMIGEIEGTLAWNVIRSRQQ